MTFHDILYGYHACPLDHDVEEFDCWGITPKFPCLITTFGMFLSGSFYAIFGTIDVGMTFVSNHSIHMSF